jgi:hypothetical protein
MHQMGRVDLAMAVLRNLSQDHILPTELSIKYETLDNITAQSCKSCRLQSFESAAFGHYYCVPDFDLPLYIVPSDFLAGISTILSRVTANPTQPTVR